MSETKANILVLFAHPSVHRSEVNVHLKARCEADDRVTLVDLYEEYPDYHIDIDREQQRLLDHDVIVFMFPLYWYSTPSILKEWQDLVLEYGFAYGKDGIALKGKTFLCSVTAGGVSEAYNAQGFNHYTLRELLRPLEQTADLTGLNYLPPLALFGARTAIEDGRLNEHLNCWDYLVEALAEDRNQLCKTCDSLNTINAHVTSLHKGAMS